MQHQLHTEIDTPQTSAAVHLLEEQLMVKQ